MSRQLQWLAAFMLAFAAHVALAAGLIGQEGAKIERGPGDGGPLVIGSIASALSESADVEAITAPQDETETAEPQDEIETVEPLDETELAETPKATEEVTPDQPAVIKSIAALAETAPQTQAPLLKTLQPPEDDTEAEPARDAVLPPLPEEPPTLLAELSEAEPRQIETLEAAAVKPEQVEPVKPRPAQVKAKPPPRKVTAKAKTKPKAKPRRRRTSAVDTRRGGSGSAGRGGGGGRGLGGRALQSNYQGRVIAHLRRYKSYPREARRRRLKGAVRVKFTINVSGRVISSRLVSSSGSSVLDAGARRTIRRANPFPPFPRGLGKRRMTFIVPIRFSVR